LWHLTHYRGERSFNYNPHIELNKNLYLEIERMTPQQLREHVETWDWHK